MTSLSLSAPTASRYSAYQPAQYRCAQSGAAVAPVPELGPGGLGPPEGSAGAAAFPAGDGALVQLRFEVQALRALNAAQAREIARLRAQLAREAARRTELLHELAP